MSNQKILVTTTARSSSPMPQTYDRSTLLKCNVSLIHLLVYAKAPPVTHPPKSSSDPPTVSSYPSGNIRLRLGSSFEITCDATGVPFPIISWRRVHPSGAIEMLAERQRHLRVEVSSREMGGAYQCLANNGIEEPAVAGVNVHVNCERIYWEDFQ